MFRQLIISFTTGSLVNKSCVLYIYNLAGLRLYYMTETFKHNRQQHICTETLHSRLKRQPSFSLHTHQANTAASAQLVLFLSRPFPVKHTREFRFFKEESWQIPSFTECKVGTCASGTPHFIFLHKQKKIISTALKNLIPHRRCTSWRTAMVTGSTQWPDTLRGHNIPKHPKSGHGRALSNHFEERNGGGHPVKF